MSTRTRRALAVLTPIAVLLLILLFAQRERLGWRRGTSSSADEPGGAAPVEGEKGHAPTSRPILQVINQEGRPVRARVRVAWSTDQFRTFEVREVDAGAVEIPKGAWFAADLRAEGYEPRFHGPAPWEGDLALALKPATERSGTIGGNNGRPLANVRIRFSPIFPPTTYSGIVAGKLGIVDAEVTTDADGRFRCGSLRPGSYRLSFPDQPKWPAVMISTDAMTALTVPWAGDR